MPHFSKYLITSSIELSTVKIYTVNGWWKSCCAKRKSLSQLQTPSVFLWLSFLLMTPVRVFSSNTRGPVKWKGNDWDTGNESRGQEACLEWQLRDHYPYWKEVSPPKKQIKHRLKLWTSKNSHDGDDSSKCSKQLQHLTICQALFAFHSLT